MSRVKHDCWRIGLLVLLLCKALPTLAVPPLPEPHQVTQQLPLLTKDADLDQLRDQLELIRQNVSISANDDLLADLQQAAVQVQKQADRLIALRTSDIDRLDNQLKVLGPAQPNEILSAAKQREKLSTQKDILLGEESQLIRLSQSSRELATQIVNLRSSLFRYQISNRSASPLSPAFWSTLIRPTEDDLERLNNLNQEILTAFETALAPGKRKLFISTLIVAALIWLAGRRLLERGLIWSVIHWIPEGRLRRSTLALMTALATILTLNASISLVFWGLSISVPLRPDVLSLMSQWMSVGIFCSFVVGLGRAILMLSHSSWRLLSLPDQIATALGPFPAILALALMFTIGEERINSVIASSLALTVAANGVTALTTSLIFFLALLRYHRTRRRFELELPEGITSLLPFALGGLLAVIVLSLLSGYLSLAYFLTVKLLWISVVAATAYLLIVFFRDLCETLLSPKQSAGMALSVILGMSPQHQAQAVTVLTGIGQTLLVLIAAIVAFMPSASSPGELLEGLTQLDVSSKSLDKFNILPQDLLSAAVLLVGGMFGVRILKRWLSERLLPETNMDVGMRTSMVTLVGYIGFVLLVIVVMSVLQINLTNLTWVVSALSVGIGFGLQAIVQNFISGLILLTERPVKVGDWVSLAGVEGDIRRINVRATEIQMSDRSTVIVPNSQFISQNVRNVTMDNALGVVGITLTLPLETNVILVRDMLLQVYAEHEAILNTPAPSVSFKDVTSNGLIISISGYVNSPRAVSGARSDLLFTILGQLRDLSIPLSSPQNLMLISDNVNRPASQPQDSNL
ncbi:DUF3772 domain-containing protein [Pseudomonas tolaasii]|uniref:DUF3772 domain-containing protein n=1 Tax=Pseudomonas tolaasii TaxID=29442 RepID=UPI00031538C5|nr:DUF3772 domain-containing protein [Pseudomonas tolaasii]